MKEAGRLQWFRITKSVSLQDARLLLKQGFLKPHSSIYANNSSFEIIVIAIGGPHHFRIPKAVLEGFKASTNNRATNRN